MLGLFYNGSPETQALAQKAMQLQTIQNKIQREAAAILRNRDAPVRANRKRLPKRLAVCLPTQASDLTLCMLTLTLTLTLTLYHRLASPLCLENQSQMVQAGPRAALLLLFQCKVHTFW